MTLVDLIRWVLLPIVIGVIGYQFKMLFDFAGRLRAVEHESLAMDDVRQLIEDKLEVLRLADRECAARIERLEA